MSSSLRSNNSFKRVSTSSHSWLLTLPLRVRAKMRNGAGRMFTSRNTTSKRMTAFVGFETTEASGGSGFAQSMLQLRQSYSENAANSAASSKLYRPALNRWIEIYPRRLKVNYLRGACWIQFGGCDCIIRLDPQRRGWLWKCITHHPFAGYAAIQSRLKNAKSTSMNSRCRKMHVGKMKRRESLLQSTSVVSMLNVRGVKAMTYH